MHNGTKNFLWIAIAVLFLAVLFMSFKAGAGGSSVSAISAATQSASSSAMVGGC